MPIAAEAALKGQQIVWGAPTYSQTEVGWRELKKAAANVATFNQAKLIANFPSGGTIYYRSLEEPDNARGLTADGIVIDECGDVKEVAWKEILRPMLMDTNGWAWLLGTPKRRNWFWRGHIEGQERVDSMAWQIPTLGCRIENGELHRVPHPLENPNIKFEELVQMFETMDERTFRQEILAEFLEDTGGVFRNVREIATETIQKPYSGRFSMGIDWAQTKDFTVIIVMDMDTKKQVDFIRFNKIGYEIQKEYVLEAFRKWKPQVIVPEYNSIGIPVVQSLMDLGLPIQPFTMSSKSKPRLIQALGLAFEKKLIRIIRNEILLNELESFEATESASGNIKYAAPDGEDQHDDCVIALALAVEGIARGGVTYVDSLWEIPPGATAKRHGFKIDDDFRSLEDIFFER